MDLSVRIENLRSLVDTGFIEVKPINVLVGRNSAGKSTFARIFPLLKQSIEVRKRAPILWWGRLVDFGGFAESVNRDSEERSIKFSFKLSLRRFGRASRTGVKSDYKKGQIEGEKVCLTVELREIAGGETGLSRINFQYLGDDYSVELSSPQTVRCVYVNGMKFQISEDLRHEVEYNSLIPEFAFSRQVVIRRDDENFRVMHRVQPLLVDAIRVFYDFGYVHGNTSYESVEQIVYELQEWSTSEQMKSGLGAVGGNINSWQQSVPLLLNSPERFEYLRNAVLASGVWDLLENINDQLTSLIARSTYLEPVRARAERYYRKQDLAVDEVDSKGANLPFFLESLKPSERERFNGWMQELLQTSSSIHVAGGQVSIRLKDSAGAEANLADVGFGYSQVLPVALQLWAVALRNSKSRKNLLSVGRPTIVIEQPELHLHPEFQAKVADMFVSAVNEGEVSIVAETHSASIINRLGVLVAEGKIARSDLQVLRFDRIDESATAIAASEFDEYGVLVDWPYGFFDH